jgi:hypothetical protein
MGVGVVKDYLDGEGFRGFFQGHEVVGEEDAPAPADLYAVVVEGEDSAGLLVAAQDHELIGVYFVENRGPPLT